ncbi:MAG TPA: putative baseplate assembly protein, partial [Actinomycetota bacterium]
MTAVANPQYRCANQRRREVVRAAGTLNGIDWLEVGADQVTLEVHLLRPAPTGMGAANVAIAGGTRVRDIRVLHADPAAEVLTVTVDRPGDFSPYELRLVDPAAGGATPAGFDPRLDAVTFSFKAACDTHLDCATRDDCPPTVLPEPQLDYLAKDYESFRGLMLDRLATTLPGWTERNPADLQVALVELLAYAADRLSYFQDAVATEAYLGTARRRVSVRRHARLLDYRM